MRARVALLRYRRKEDANNHGGKRENMVRIKNLQTRRDGAGQG